MLPFTAAGSTCESGRYLCGNGECIDASLKCNGDRDCLDGSDEGTLAACPSESRALSSCCYVTFIFYLLWAFWFFLYYIFYVFFLCCEV
jgi:hypothetical protein